MPETNRKYFLGIDTGATKTHALIINAEGKVLAFEVGGPANPQSIGGYHALEKMLSELVQRACGSAGISPDIIFAAGLGLAGYDWPSQYDRFYQAARSAGLPVQSFLVNDAALGIYAGAAQGWGICVAAGTSFNCRGIGPGGRQARAIGDGLKWGEGAGALELSVKAAQKVIAHWLHTGSETRLTDIYLKEFGADSLADLVEGMVLRRYPVTAGIAPRIFEIAQEGDEAANRVVLWAAGKLADLAIGAARQLDLEDQTFEIVLSGSFFKAGKILTAPMKDKILTVAPQAEFHLLDIPPVCGAVILAMRQTSQIETNNLGQIKDQLRDYFIL